MKALVLISGAALGLIFGQFEHEKPIAPKPLPYTYKLPRSYGDFTQSLPTYTCPVALFNATKSLQEIKTGVPGRKGAFITQEPAWKEGKLRTNEGQCVQTGSYPQTAFLQISTQYRFSLKKDDKTFVLSAEKRYAIYDDADCRCWNVGEIQPTK